MEHLIGKKLALVPDVKLDGRMNITTIMQRLLETIGEDVNRLIVRTRSSGKARLASDG